MSGQRRLSKQACRPPNWHQGKWVIVVATNVAVEKLEKV